MNGTEFDWNGPAVQAQVMARVNLELHRMGTFFVQHMQGYAPVNTGALRAGIHADVDEAAHVLTVTSPATYSVYQEFGTRHIRPHPYIRPSIVDAQAIWRFLEVTLILRPPAQKSEPLIASASGFRLPRRQKLTAKQVEHVRRHLVPTSKHYARRIRGRGTKFVVRRFD